ncbi:hypothetical protein ACT2CV_08270 [Pasteurellaceae bacterium 22721_9_1]
MPINFTQLFKDSWHFLQNQRQFSITFLVILSLNTLMAILLHPTVAIENAEALTQEQRMEILLQQTQNADGRLITVVQFLVGLFISYWGILTVHKISQREFQGIIPTAISHLPRLLGAIIMALMILIPVLISIVYLATAVLSHLFQGVEPISPLPALILVIIASWLAIRLCLSPIAYLSNNSSFRNTLKVNFQLGKKGYSSLFFYCVINYFLATILNAQIALLARNEVMMILAVVLTSALNLFLMVFSYRFYQVFTQKAS